VTLTFPATCPTFTACGGGLPGNFVYTAGCVDDGEFAPFVAQGEQNCGTGSVTLSNKSGTIQGTVAATASTVSRNVTGGINFTASIGGACGNAMTCPFVAMGLMTNGFTGTCSYNGMGACVCAVSRAFGTIAGAAYTAGVNQFTLTASSRVFDYCLNMSVLRYHEVSAAQSTRDLGYYTLGP